MESNKEANLDVTDYVGEWLKKMKHFPQIFEELTVMQKRDFLRMIIEKVVWDGEIAHIYIRNPVPGRHWDIFARLKEEILRPWYPKFPTYTQCIATAARAYDSCEAPFGNLQIDVRKCGGFSLQIVIGVGNIPQRKYWLHRKCLLM